MTRWTITARLALVAALAWLPLAHAAPGDDAAAVIARLQSSLVEVAAAQPALTLEQRFDALAPVVRETHDLTTMARLTVRRFWRRWSEEQRASFGDVFGRLSITTYASRFANIGPDTFAILGASEAGEDLYDVDAVIRRRDDDDVPMRYQLGRDGDSWRIINVFADGVSELSLMGSEYFDILENGDFDDLIAELERQITDL
jgi:phospholipid transport system substrate-binding protein